VAGNTQIWGLLGVQKEVAFAARSVIVVVEEIVDQAVIRADPNRTLIPGLIVEAVVHEPYAAHPSYAQGYYDRDNAFYLAWDELSRDRARTEAWLAEWVYGVSDRAAYLRKLGAETLERLKPGRAPAGAIDYGSY
jgi:glutaconate CoA-transferase subunit A